jgi:hypothetical protein
MIGSQLHWIDNQNIKLYGNSQIDSIQRVSSVLHTFLYKQHEAIILTNRSGTGKGRS